MIGNDVTGWFIPAGDGVYPWGLQDGAFGASTPFGNQWVVLGLYTSGVEYSIQQTMTGFTIGNSYTLSFSIASEEGCCSQALVSFLDGSSTGAQIFFAPNSGQYWTAWQTFSMNFVATANNVTVQFKNINPSTNGHDLGLDNVSVVDAVPEPATLLLLGTGLAAAGVRRRLKKRS